MKYSNLQLDIIRLFGSKELIFGCLVRLKDDFKGRYFTIEKTDVLTVVHIDSKYENLVKAPRIRGVLELPNQTKNEFEILGHEPHLEDVFRVANERDWIIKIEYNYSKQEYVGITIDNSFGEDDIYALISYNPTLPLLEQSEETLTQLINLFK